MKPEERILLELAHDAIETAGHAVGDVELRNAGVYMGVTANTYALHRQGTADTSLFGLANRVSHSLCCTGPSFTLDAGCTSALTAIHLACEALRSGSVPMAVAGAINLLLHPEKLRMLQSYGLIAPAEYDGLFPADGSGFVPGEGGGVVVLTTLSRALANGDYVWGVIDASALSHQGGERNYRLPSPGASRQHLAHLLAQSGTDSHQINYVELQALGAELADASEWAALVATVGTDGATCPAGSVKPAIGHLEAASGIAQLTKVLLQMRYGKIPPSPVSRHPNPELAVADSRFYFPDSSIDWEVDREKRRALITSSGIGGSLASLIVSEAEPRTPMLDESRRQMVVLSAKTADQLDRRRDDLYAYLTSASPRPSLADACFTLQSGRTHHRYRMAWVVASWEELIEQPVPSWQGRIDIRLEAAEPAGIEEAAAAWVTGTPIPECFLAVGRRVPLPTYPYERLRCWLDTAQEQTPASSRVLSRPEGVESQSEDAGAASRGVVASYYNRVAGTVADEVKDQDIHLVFAPFLHRLPGYRWLQTFFEPDQCPEHYAETLRAQREMKELLFSGVTWQETGRVLDVGCGFATDLIALANKHPRLEATGYTITPKQAELGTQRIASAGLAGRVDVCLADSTKDEFSGDYDAALAFEVLFHIRDKHALIANLSRHLRPGGTLLIADCLANTVASINHDAVGLYTCRPVELAHLLADSGFELIRAIDVGKEISNFLVDEDFEATLAHLRARHPDLAHAEAEHRAWHNCGKAFAMGLIRYVLLTARFDTSKSSETLRLRNVAALDSAESYSDVISAGKPMQAEKIGSQPRVSMVELRQLAAQVIGIPQRRIEEDIPLAEFGVDSLVGLKLLDTINRRFGIGLELQTLFDSPTLAGLRSRADGALPAVDVAATEVATTPEPIRPKYRAEPRLARAENTPIAIVGMAGRFPRARNTEEYWENILAGVDSVADIPASRWDVDQFYDPDPNQLGRSCSRWGGFVDGVDLFDAKFFRVTRAEAEVMDPQQRLFLETCWEALENAGYAGPALNGAACGVVAGAINNDYQMLLGRTSGVRNLGHAMLGNAASILAARVSYLLDLKGPALSIDSACSSSLVAVHLACQSLRDGDADVMLAGGVTLYLDETPYLMMSKSGMLSPTGRCRPFSAQADGIAVGEAVGVVALKRLSDALADRDTIHGVIRASRVNQDGLTNGITAPSSESQQALLTAVYRQAGINPNSIGLVEAHGTGTKLGDPVEIAALTAAFREYTDRSNFCAVGSVKGNIGHTSAGAGVAGLIKATLAVREGVIPPSLHAEHPNELLRLESSPFYLASRPQPWSGSRLAAVSAFGFSGTNCHVLVEEPPPAPEAGPDCDSIVTLSAATRPQLHELAVGIYDWTGCHRDLRACDIAYTLDHGRMQLAERAQFRAASLSELREKLLAYVEKRPLAGVYDGGEHPPLAAPADVRRVPLPTYPFARERYWFRTEEESTAAAGLQREIEMSIDSEVLLREHKVFGRHSMPVDALLDIVYRQAVEILRSVPIRIRDVALFTPLWCEPGETRRMLVEVSGDGPLSIELSSTGAEPDRKHHLRAVAEVETAQAPSRCSSPTVQPLAERAGAAILREGKALELGEFFHTIDKASFWPDRARADLLLSEPAHREAARFALHPALLDSIFGLAHSLAGQSAQDSQVAYLPFCMQDVQVFAPLKDRAYQADIRVTTRTEEFVRYDADLIGLQGDVVVAIRGLDQRRVSPDMFSQKPSTSTVGKDSAARAKLRLKPTGHSGQSPLSTTESVPVVEPRKSAPTAAPTLGQLRDLLAEVMLCAPSTLDQRRSLVEQGVDSILGLEFVQRINRTFGLRLQGTVLFEHPTLEDLTEALGGIDEPAAGAGSQPAETHALESRQPQRAEAVPQRDPFVSAPPQVDPLQATSLAEGDGHIAVIGMAGRFPGAATLDELWHHLANNDCLITDVPLDHWDYRPHFDPETPGGMYCKRGGFIDSVDRFDPLFFNISPREAETMDPQLRLLFEVLWEAFEDAGYAGRVRGTRTGIYLGNCYNDYLDLMKQHSNVDFQFAGSGNSNSMLSNRVAYYFDLTGPCMTLDTACSSSLVALHLAAQALRDGDCDMAVAGGVNLSLSASKYLNFCAIGAFSKSGAIRPFSANADGYLPGEGVVSVLLKPLEAALVAGDRIHGILLGSAVRCAGRSPGPTVPNHAIETATMVDAWRSANIDPETITYLEAHGTGTRIGDPLEVNAIKRSFAQFTNRTGFCQVGTVKANIGHTEAAAGLAGVVKTLLQMRHRTIAGIPGLLPLNPMIEIDGTPIVFESESRPWRSPKGAPLRAGVSSFGMGGTYAHAVLQEHIEPTPPTVPEDAPQTIVLSARTRTALKDSVSRLAEFLERNPAVRLADVAYTLAFGRERMEETWAFHAQSVADATRQLLTADIDQCATPSIEVQPPAGGRLIALPSYPFESQRYWLPTCTSESGNLGPRLVPDWAAATGNGLTFRCQFDPDEVLLDQHRVYGEAILPATASLLLACEAASLIRSDFPWQLRNIVWHNTINAGPLELRVDRQDASCQWLLSGAKGVEHASGVIEMHADESRIRLDESIRHSFNGPRVESEALYTSFEAAGIAYGRVFRALQYLSIAGDQALGEWKAAAGAPAAAVLDSALQSACALFSEQSDAAIVPWSLGRVTLHGALPSAGYCLIRRVREGSFDAFVADLDGNVCVEFESFAVRRLPAKPGTGLKVYGWTESIAQQPVADGPEIPENIVVVAEAAGEIGAQLSRSIPAAAIVNNSSGISRALAGGIPDEVWFVGEPGRSAVAAESELRLLHKLVRSLSEAGADQCDLRIYVLAGGPFGAGLLALARSVANEHPRWMVEAAEIDATSISRETISQLRCGPAISRGEELTYRGGRRFVRRLQPISVDDSGASPVRVGGVYLIAGGAQGIGYETARWLAREYSANLILMGRSPLADPIWSRVRELERVGAQAIYVRADLSDIQSLWHAVEIGRAEFGPVQGVVHSAMVLHDGLLASLDDNGFAEPLRAKMSGLENLREVLRSDPLAFALVHSSVQSVLGNAGQSNYAAASAFADSFANVWRSEVSFPVKTVNWTYWGSVGAVATEEYRQRMRAVGVESIEPGEAFPVVERLLRSTSVNQIYAVKAAERFLPLLGIENGTAKAATSSNGGSSPLARSLVVLKEVR